MSQIGVLGYAETADKLDKSRIVAQVSEAGLDVQKDNPIESFFIGLFQPIHRRVVVARTGMNYCEMVGGHKGPPCTRGQFGYQRLLFLRVTEYRIGMRQLGDRA